MWHRSTTSLCGTVTVMAYGTASREGRTLTVVGLERETPFAARLPLIDDGLAYWTVLDAGFRRVPVVDNYLFSLARSGRAENTGKAYARDIAIFLRWCDSRRRHWQDVAALTTSRPSSSSTRPDTGGVPGERRRRIGSSLPCGGCCATASRPATCPGR